MWGQRGAGPPCPGASLPNDRLLQPPARGHLGSRPSCRGLLVGAGAGEVVAICTYFEMQKFYSVEGKRIKTKQ